MHAFVSTAPDERVTQAKRLKQLLVHRAKNVQPEPTPPHTMPWLVSPAVDVLFVCGMMPWVLGGLAWAVLGNPLHELHANFVQRGFTVLYVVCALVIGEGHQFTSILRFHFTPWMWKKRWASLPPLIGMWLGWMAFSMISIPPEFEELNAALAGFASLGIFLFPVVLVHHFCIQAQAIVLMYCAKSGYKVPRGQLWWFRIATWLLVAGGGCAMAVPFGMTESIVVLDEAPRYAIPLMVASLLCVVLPAWRRGKAKGEWPPVFATLLWVNLTAYLMVPMQAAGYVWVFVPIFFHASQHWVVAYATRRKESLAAKSGRHAVHDLLRAVLPVQAVSLVVLFAPLLTMHLPQHVVTQKDFDTLAATAGSFTLPVTWSMFVFYMHYFTDRIVWRPK